MMFEWFVDFCVFVFFFVDDWQDDGSYVFGVLEYDFVVCCVMLIVLFVVVIVLLCIYVVVMVYNDLKVCEVVVSDVMMCMVCVVEEYVFKVFDLSEMFDVCIVDFVQDMDDVIVCSREFDIYEVLNMIGGGYLQVVVVLIFGVSGMLFVNSFYYLVLYVLIVNCDDFVGICDGKVIEYILWLMMGLFKFENIFVFNMGVVWCYSDGLFVGMVLIVLKLLYFNVFYCDLFGGVSMLMMMVFVCLDGVVIVLYLLLLLFVYIDCLIMFGNVCNDLCVGVVCVCYDGVSSEIVVYCQVGSYFVYVSCVYCMLVIWYEWYEYLSVLFFLMFVLLVVLWFVIWLLFKWLKVEEEVWDCWQVEVLMWCLIELVYWQLCKMQVFGNFVGSVVYDFNNLLMIILSNVQIVWWCGVQYFDKEFGVIECVLKNGQLFMCQLFGVVCKQLLYNEMIDVG